MNCFPKVCLQSLVVVMATACFGLTTAQATPLTVEFTPDSLNLNPAVYYETPGTAYSQTVSGVGVTLTASNLSREVNPFSVFDGDGISVSYGEIYNVQFSQPVTVDGFTVGFSQGIGNYDFYVNDSQTPAFSLSVGSAMFVSMVGETDQSISLQPTDVLKISSSFFEGLGQLKSLSFTTQPVPEPTFHAAGAIGMACVGLLLRRRAQLASRG